MAGKSAKTNAGKLIAIGACALAAALLACCGRTDDRGDYGQSNDPQVSDASAAARLNDADDRLAELGCSLADEPNADSIAELAPSERRARVAALDDFETAAHQYRRARVVDYRRRGMSLREARKAAGGEISQVKLPSGATVSEGLETSYKLRALLEGRTLRAPASPDMRRAPTDEESPAPGEDA